MRKEVDRRLVRLADTRETTVHVTAFRLEEVMLRVVRMTPEAPLEEWCAREGVANAISGGYSVKPEYEPLGELRIDGSAVDHRPFADPWRAHRGALVVSNGGLAIERRDNLPGRPEGSLLQAGPLLVRDGRSAIAEVEDPEGFSATAEEFDQDLTADREPRLAIALTPDRFLAVAADGRTPQDAGLTLWSWPTCSSSSAPAARSTWTAARPASSSWTAAASTRRETTRERTCRRPRPA